MTEPATNANSPLDTIWIQCAKDMGLTLHRTDNAYVSSTGNGQITIASDDDLDEDDSLAQLIFHEICHSLVEGPESFSKRDWGLDNTTKDDVEREYAACRTQKFLAVRYGLSSLFRPTTEYGTYYDSLTDCLAPKDTTSSRLAHRGIINSNTSPWAPHLAEALQKTAHLLKIPAASTHPTGRRNHSQNQCGQCFWFVTDNKKTSCRQFDFTSVLPQDTPACDHFETPTNCQHCGACCREAYHSVTIEKSDPFCKNHPQLVVYKDAYTEVQRTGKNCAALAIKKDSYACTVYTSRPIPCREFENASANCLTARRRIGLSL